MARTLSSSNKIDTTIPFGVATEYNLIFSDMFRECSRGAASNAVCCCSVGSKCSVLRWRREIEMIYELGQSDCGYTLRGVINLQALVKE